MIVDTIIVARLEKLLKKTIKQTVAFKGTDTDDVFYMRGKCDLADKLIELIKEWKIKL